MSRISEEKSVQQLNSGNLDEESEASKEENKDNINIYLSNDPSVKERNHNKSLNPFDFSPTTFDKFTLFPPKDDIN